MAKKKKYNSEDFFKLLKQVETASTLGAFFSELGIAQPFVFVSKDSLRVRRSLQWMRESVPGLSNTEIVTYFAADLGAKNAIAPIVQALSSPSLFSKEQIIVIHNANKLKAVTLEELRVAASRPDLFSMLLLLTEELSAGLEKIGCIVEFEEFSRAKISRWIKKEFSDLGFESIDSETAAFLSESFTGSLGELSADISRICLLSVYGESVGVELAKKIVSSNVEASSFDLFASISQGKVALAQDKLHQMYRQGMHPLQINAFLSRCYRTLLAQRGQIVSKELSNPWFAGKVKGFSKAYPAKYLVKVLNKLSELDFALKDSGLPAEDLMSNAVLHFSLRN